MTPKIPEGTRGSPSARGRPPAPAADLWFGPGRRGHRYLPGPSPRRGRGQRRGSCLRLGASCRPPAWRGTEPPPRALPRPVCTLTVPKPLQTPPCTGVPFGRTRTAGCAPRRTPAPAGGGDGAGTCAPLCKSPRLPAKRPGAGGDGAVSFWLPASSRGRNLGCKLEGGAGSVLVRGSFRRPREGPGTRLLPTPGTGRADGHLSALGCHGRGAGNLRTQPVRSAPGLRGPRGTALQQTRLRAGSLAAARVVSPPPAPSARRRHRVSSSR